MDLRGVGNFLQQSQGAFLQTNQSRPQTTGCGDDEMEASGHGDWPDSGAGSGGGLGPSTYEIGIRMALGARKSSVLALVLSFGLKLVVCGVAIWLAISFAVTRVLESLLFVISVPYPLTFASVTVLLP